MTFPRRALHALVLTVLLFATSAIPRAMAQADAIIEIILDRSAAHGVSGAWLVSIVRCESRFNPYAVGAQGELGIAQLHPRGELRTFYARGYSSPFSVW